MRSIEEDGSDVPVSHHTLHLVAEPDWRALQPGAMYRPQGFDEEGFVHCTDGEELIVDVANRYYRDDPREYLALDIDLNKVTAPVRYEDPERVYPHIYGPIERRAIVRVRRVERAPDGSFTRIGESMT